MEMFISRIVPEMTISGRPELAISGIYEKTSFPVEWPIQSKYRSMVPDMSVFWYTRNGHFCPNVK